MELNPTPRSIFIFNVITSFYVASISRLYDLDIDIID